MEDFIKKVTDFINTTDNSDAELEAKVLLGKCLEHFEKDFDPIEYILKYLPCTVEYDGHEFEFRCINDGGTEFRVLYSPVYDLPDMWYNPLIDSYCDFLYLHELPSNLAQFRIALLDCRAFLANHDLLPSEFLDSSEILDI